MGAFGDHAGNIFGTHDSEEESLRRPVDGGQEKAASHPQAPAQMVQELRKEGTNVIFSEKYLGKIVKLNKKILGLKK